MGNDDNQLQQLFTEKALEVAIEHSKSLLTLFSAIIAGLIALVVEKTLGPWTGMWFLAASVSAIVGLSASLVHMSYTSKVLFLYAALFAQQKDPVGVLAPSTELAALKLSDYLKKAQVCYQLQLYALFFVAVMGCIGLSCMLWEHVRLLGIVVAYAVVTAFFLVLIGIAAWFLKSLRKNRTT